MYMNLYYTKPSTNETYFQVSILFQVTPSLNRNIPLSNQKFNIYLINTESRSISLMHRKLLPKVPKYIYLK